MRTTSLESSPNAAPVFGILTMPDEERRFRGNTKNFIDIIRTGEEKIGRAHV